MTFSLDLSFVDQNLITEAQSWRKEARRHLDDLIHGRCLGSEFSGWFDDPEKRGFGWVKEILKQKENLGFFYDAVVVVGIGGSFAGARAVSDSFNAKFAYSESQSRQHPVFYTGYHLSEAALDELLNELDTYEPLFFVASKSGTTLETAALTRIIETYARKRYGESLPQRFMVCTDSDKGALRELANRRGYPSFEVPSDIGGRFSVLSPVGLVPLGFAGFDIESLVAGAHSVYQELKKPTTEESCLFCDLLTYTCLRKAAWEKDKRVEVMAYSEPKLGSFIEWWKQLFGESEGKAEHGLFPAGALFSTDLHSLGQYLQEGPPIILETFLEFAHRSLDYREGRIKVPSHDLGLDKLAAFEGTYLDELTNRAMDAAARAHHDRGLSCPRLKFGAFDPYHMGVMFAFFQTVCAVSALLLGVNPFDQPGVEAYKSYLRQSEA